MNDRSPPIARLGMGAVLIAVIAAILGVRLGNDTGKSSEKRAAEPAAETEAAPLSTEDDQPHRSFVLDYFYPPSITERRKEAGSDTSAVFSLQWHFNELSLRGDIQSRSALPSAQRTFQKGDARHTECLIASVPDPVDTPFAFLFDQVIEGLTRAAGAANYSPAGHMFPWEGYRRTRGTIKKKPGDSSAAPFEEYPGVMLFRGKNDSSRTFVLLLVGETANGTRPRVLKRSFDLIHEIHGSRKSTSEKKEVIRLIAPFFSGAQVGLFRAMDRWAANLPSGNVSFDIISGSANGLDLCMLSKIINANQKCDYKLRSTVIPSIIQQNAAIQFLGDYSLKNGAHITEELPEGAARKVALLVESNTGFGQLQTMPHHKNQEQADKRPTYFLYPINLSRVHAWYAEQRAEKEKRYHPEDAWLPGGEHGQQPRSNPDTVASLDETTTPRLADRAVDDITAEIRRGRFHHVGISATDPQDVIYLVERIKRDCPTVEIFVTGMDLLYMLPENEQTMRGVVVSSTYSLFPPNQKWANLDDPVQQAFQSESAQGFYNAAVFHMSELSCSPSIPLREYSQPAFARNGIDQTYLNKPPVWVFCIGDNGHHVPHRFYVYDTRPPDFMATRSESDSGPSDRAVERPRLGTFMALLGILLLTAGVVIVWMGRGGTAADSPVFPTPPWLPRRDDWKKIGSWFLAPMCKTEQRDGVYHDLALTAVLIGLTPFLVILCILSGPSFQMRREWSWDRIYIATVVVLVVTAGALLLQVRSLWRFATVPGGKRMDYWGGWLAVRCLLFVSVLAFATFLTVSYSNDNAAGRVLFVERAVNMQTGYSALAPLFLLVLGVLVSAYFFLQRRYVARRFRIECPYPKPADRALDPAVAPICSKLCDVWSDLDRDLASLIALLRRNLSWTVVAAIVYAIGFLLIAFQYHGSYEGVTWNVVFIAGFSGLAGLMILNTTRFLIVWKELEKLLKLMALLPMVRAFDRLPQKVADLFGGYFRARRPRASHLTIPLHLLRLLRHEAANQASKELAHPPTLHTVAAGVPAQAQIPTTNDCAFHIVGRLNGTDAWPNLKDGTPDDEYPGEQFNALSEVARELIADLARYWPHHTIQNAFGEEPPAEREEKKGGPEKPADGANVEAPSWVRMAEEFVAVQAIVFVSQFFIQLRKLADAVVCLSVILMLAATAYPFQPETLILYVFFALLLGVAGSIVWVMIRLNKNEIVSRLTRSTPNKFELNWEFVTQFLLYIGPILLVVIARFSGRLRILVEPFLNVIR